MDLTQYINEYKSPQERIDAIRNLIFRVCQLVAEQRKTPIKDSTIKEYIREAAKQDIPQPLLDACMADCASFIESAIAALWKFDRFSKYKVDETILQEAINMLALPSELKGNIYIPRAIFGDAVQFLTGHDCEFENRSEHKEAHAIAKVRAYFHGYDRVEFRLNLNMFAASNSFSNTRKYNTILAYVATSSELKQLYTKNLGEYGKMAVIMPQVDDERSVQYELIQQGARVRIKRLGINEPNIWLIDCSLNKNDVYACVADVVNNIEDQASKDALLKLLYSDVNIKLMEGDSSYNNLNGYRKITEWICGYLHAYGLIENYVGPNQLAALMRRISIKEDQLDEEDKNGAYEYIIPPYVNKSMQACNNAAQAGSHQQSQTTRDFNAGIAPYLDKSVLYNLLNVLYWALSLPKDPIGKQDVLDRWNKISMDGLECDKHFYISLTKCVEKTDGVYHIAKCKINLPKGKNQDDLEGVEITIKSVGKNQGSSLYLFYTNDYEIKN